MLTGVRKQTYNTSVAQLDPEHRPTKSGVAGSSPARGVNKEDA